MFWQVVLKAEGKVHSATLRDVQLSEAGQVKLTAKDFQTEASLNVRGETPPSTREPSQVLSAGTDQRDLQKQNLDRKQMEENFPCISRLMLFPSFVTLS